MKSLNEIVVSKLFICIIGLVLISAFVNAVQLPALNAVKTINPTTIIEGDNATINITVFGTGDPIFDRDNLDVMLVLDKSGSMAGDKITKAKDASKLFIDRLDPTKDRAGLVSFSSNAYVDGALGTDYSQIKSSIDALSANGGTNMGWAISTATSQLINESNTRIEILLSDGKPTLPDCGGLYSCPADVDYTLEEAQNAAEQGILIYTIGLGSDADSETLTEIANITGGKYYYAPSASDLEDILSNISGEITNLVASDIIITDILPVGVIPVSMNLPCSYDSSIRTVTCLPANIVYIGNSLSYSFDVAVYNTSLTQLNVYTDVNYTKYDNTPGQLILAQPQVVIIPKIVCFDNDHDGYFAGMSCNHTIIDCNDNDSAINPNATEICDGIDNDCNPLTSDGSLETWFNQQTSCGLGACAATGSFVCTNGTKVDTCSAGTPINETCDNLDNNCNGIIDDDLERFTENQLGLCSGNIQYCSTGSWFDKIDNYLPTNESCDLLDNDCDGTVDEFIDLGTIPAENILGVCSENVKLCTQGSWIDSLNNSAPTGETCNNLDDDCDGNIDENLTLSLGELGICSANTQTCSAGEWLNNSNTTIPTIEICNNLDDDCDGSIDENIGTAPADNILGACSGNTKVCSLGLWINNGGNYAPISESCNGIDDDCDGNVDEGCGGKSGSSGACNTQWKCGEWSVCDSGMQIRACSYPEGYCEPKISKPETSRICISEDIGSGLDWNNSTNQTDGNLAPITGGMIGKIGKTPLFVFWAVMLLIILGLLWFILRKK